MTQREDLVALVGSRICHDLISPLGAIGNGVELMGLSGSPQGPEMELINDSVANATARVQFFRMALGHSSAEATVSRGEITQVLAASARGDRLSYFWSPEGPQRRMEVRGVFLALMCLETALPHGGDIHVSNEGDVWRVTGEGDRLALDEALWTGLTTPSRRPKVSPALVQFALLPIAVMDMDRHLAVKPTESRVELRF